MTAGGVTADSIDRSLNDPHAVPPVHGLNSLDVPGSSRAPDPPLVVGNGVES
jgi:hypothetical protein